MWNHSHIPPCMEIPIGVEIRDGRYKVISMNHGPIYDCTWTGACWIQISTPGRNYRAEYTPDRVMLNMGTNGCEGCPHYERNDVPF